MNYILVVYLKMTRNTERARTNNNFKQQMASHYPPSEDSRLLIKEGWAIDTSFALFGFGVKDKQIQEIRRGALKKAINYGAVNNFNLLHSPKTCDPKLRVDLHFVISASALWVIVDSSTISRWRLKVQGVGKYRLGSLEMPSRNWGDGWSWLWNGFVETG